MLATTAEDLPVPGNDGVVFCGPRIKTCTSPQTESWRSSMQSLHSITASLYLVSDILAVPEEETALVGFWTCGQQAENEFASIRGKSFRYTRPDLIVP